MSYTYDEDRCEVYDDNDSDHIEGWCSECHQKCTSETFDDGIGAYEYWGTRGTHHCYVEVSPCCQADMLEHEPELELEVESA